MKNFLKPLDFVSGRQLYGSALGASSVVLAKLFYTAELFTDDSMYNYLRNRGAYGAPYNALAYASNHIYHDGVTHNTPCEIVHTLGAEQNPSADCSATTGFSFIYATGASDGDIITVTTDATLSETIIYRDHVGLIGKTVKVVVDVTQLPANGTFRLQLRDAWVLDPSNDISLNMGLNEIEFSIPATYVTPRILIDGKNLLTGDDFKITTFSVKEITLPAVSYLTYYDTAGKNLVELSSTGDRATNIPLNDTFSDGLTTGWVPNTSSSISSVSGAMRVTLISTVNPPVTKAITTVPGRKYTVSVDIISSSVVSNRYLRAGSTIFGVDLLDTHAIASTLSGTFVATTTTTYISLVIIATVIGDYVDWDNVVVKEILPKSTHFNVTNSFQYAIPATAPLSDADIAYIDANPNALYDVQFNGLILPSGFSASDIAYFYDGTQGNAGADTVWNIARKFTSRASTGTYRDGGVLKYAAVDEARYEDGFLLSEVASTNISLQSNSVGATTLGVWTSNNTVFTENSHVAPDGTTTANDVQHGSTAAGGYTEDRNVPCDTIQPITFSVFIKQSGSTFIIPALYVYSLTTTNNFSVRFDIFNKVINGTSASGDSILIDYEMKELSDGWFRCSITGIPNTVTDEGSLFSTRVLLWNLDGTRHPIDYTGVATDCLALWGAQVEQLDHLTSYIPTTTTAVTRAADLPAAKDAKIINHTTNCNTNFVNMAYGASNLKLVKDAIGRTTGVAPAGVTIWDSDSRQAVTNWTITAPFTITEVLDGVTYTWTSDGNKYIAGVPSGTYTLPTGVWTLNDTGFDDLTAVTQRGTTKLETSVIIP